MTLRPRENLLSLTFFFGWLTSSFIEAHLFSVFRRLKRNSLTQSVKRTRAGTLDMICLSYFSARSLLLILTFTVFFFLSDLITLMLRHSLHSSPFKNLLSLSVKPLPSVCGFLIARNSSRLALLFSLYFSSHLASHPWD